jgi:hypothetical protein
MDIYKSNLIIRRRFLKMSIWKTWSDVRDKMVVEKRLTRNWSWWTMYRRRVSGSIGVEIPDVMENDKWMFNLRNQASHEESHIPKCQSLLNQDNKWLGDQNWKLIIQCEVFQVTTSKSQCGNPHEVKKMKWQESILCKFKLKNCILYLILSICCRSMKRDTTWITNKV